MTAEWDWLSSNVAPHFWTLLLWVWAVNIITAVLRATLYTARRYRKRHNAERELLVQAAMLIAAMDLMTKMPPSVRPTETGHAHSKRVN